MDALRAAFAAGVLGLVAFIAWRSYGQGGQMLRPSSVDEFAGDFAWENYDPGNVAAPAEPAPYAWPAWVTSAAESVQSTATAIYSVATGAPSSSTAGMRISADGLEQIKRHEAFRANQYYDQGGKLTIGYGHLVKPLELFGTITEGQALELLASDVAIAESAVNRGVTVPITQSQFDALVSLAYNIGAGGFASSSVLRRLNAGDVAGAADAFSMWNKVTINGALMVSAGLTNRRAAEAQYFLSGGAYG